MEEQVSFELSNSQNNSFSKDNNYHLELEQKLAKVINENENLVKLIKQIDKDNVDTKKQKSEQENILKKLKNEMENLLQMNHYYKQENDGLKSELQIQLEQNIDLQTSQKKLIQELEISNQHHSSNHQQLESLKSEKQLLVQQITTMQYDFSAQTGQKQGSQEQLKRENEILNQKVMEQNSDIKELRETLSHLVENNETLVSQVTQQEQKNHAQLENALKVINQNNTEKIQKLDQMYAQKFIEQQQQFDKKIQDQINSQNEYYQNSIKDMQKKFKAKMKEREEKIGKLQVMNETLLNDVEEYKYNFEQQSIQFQSMFLSGIKEPNNNNISTNEELDILNQTILSRCKELSN